VGEDSGVFPDFVLALDEASTFGNGSILELKDSDGSSMCFIQFHHPTRFKSLIEGEGDHRKQKVLEAAWLRDFPHSLASGMKITLAIAFTLSALIAVNRTMFASR
jgi:hypothetical protein